MKLTGVPHKMTWGTETWFTPSDAHPLLVKFLVTHQDLSVQVHPNKTEMWHVLQATEGARVGIGLTREASKDELRAACADGSVMDLMQWLRVRKGDTFFLPTGVVHAMGAGLSVCEVQQNRGVTLRLYDYERGRELHLEQGLEVAARAPYNGKTALPVNCEFFRVARGTIGTLVACIDGAEAGHVWMPDGEQFDTGHSDFLAIT